MIENPDNAAEFINKVNLLATPRAERDRTTPKALVPPPFYLPDSESHTTPVNDRIYDASRAERMVRQLENSVAVCRAGGGTPNILRSLRHHLRLYRPCR